MKIEEAIALANRIKAKHRQPLDKLQRSDALAKHVASVTALTKRYATLGGTVVNLQKCLDQIRADLDHVENNPGAKRIIH
jgi:hypothetical protein